jgi:hypothetical protein
MQRNQIKWQRQHQWIQSLLQLLCKMRSSLVLVQTRHALALKPPACNAVVHLLWRQTQNTLRGITHH